MIYGSVCSGIEAATVAWHPLGWTPKFFAEIEAFPSAVLAHHYGSNMPGEPLATNGVPNHGDFTKISADAGPVDLLVGGTPCQSFSVAGKRLGLDDPRGNLALEYLALARRLGARWIVWENVPGVLSSRSGDETAEAEEDGGAGFESADFATFLDFVRQCGYGFAYRILDAQYVRVDGFARAVPQRRRRVFLVGYLGDWRIAAAVLLEREGLCGHPPPRREAGQGTAPTIASRPTGGGGLGIDFDLDGGLIAFGGNNQSGPLEVATAVNAHGGPHGRVDFESETFVAHSLKGEGFDASEDGSGRGTPIVPMTLAIRGRGGANSLEWRQDGTANAILTPNGGRAGIGVGAIAFNSREDPDVSWDRTGSLGSSIPQAQAVAFDLVQATSPENRSRPQDLSPSVTKQGRIHAASTMAVRRLTPTECERLQGFRDGYTDVPFRGRSAADGPRYKALGNSMAVNAMRWIGTRIDIMEGLIKAGRIAP